MKDYKIKINYVRPIADTIFIGWSANVGFGVLTINICGETFEIETETMGEEFYKQVLAKAKEYILEHSKIVE